MIILFKETSTSNRKPIVILDYTRSDEQYSSVEIQKYITMFAGANAYNLTSPNIYSLDYSANFTHSGINYGKSLKQSFDAVIVNAPTELVKLLNIEQYASQQNINALTKAVNNVIDPQVKFPTGGIVFKALDGTTITRQFMIYSTPYNFDPLRINSNLQLHGSHYDSMVLRLQFAVSILKNVPLLPQIQNILAKENLAIDGESLATLGTQLPALDKYYAPQPLNITLQEICQDNNLTFDINDGTISFQSLNPNLPPSPMVKNYFSFKNSVFGSKAISSFSLNNYVSCEFESEIYDPELFTSVAVYDDSNTSNLLTDGGIFANLTKSPDLVSGFAGYRFYVQEYTLHDSRAKTSCTTKGTNNWLVNNFKLDYLLENKIYQGVI